MGKSCTTPWGTTVEDGYSVEAYKDAKVKYGETPQWETRVCHDGELSGSYGNRESVGLPKGEDPTPE